MVVRLILAVILCFPVAAAAEQLTGDKAWRYIGDLGQKLTEQPYYAITLDRRNRNPQTAGFVDALVCVPGQESYRYVRRQDDNHLLSIGETGASRLQAQLVRPETLAYYCKLILDNRLKPVVILEASGRESGIVFCGINSCSVVAGSRQDGSVYLEVKKSSFLSDKTELPFRVVPDTAETIK